MNKPSINFGRRAFLRGLGASVALPAFRSLGVEVKAAAAARGVTATGAPLRMAYLYVPNGVIMDKWRPEGTGSDFKFNESMKSLNEFKKDLQIVKGLEQANGATASSYDWDFGDGATSVLQHPAHTYMGSGTYTVSLSVTTQAGSNAVAPSAAAAVRRTGRHW